MTRREFLDLTITAIAAPVVVPAVKAPGDLWTPAAWASVPRHGGCAPITYKMMEQAYQRLVDGKWHADWSRV